MSAATLNAEPSVAGLLPPSGSASALHSLMQMWEEEAFNEEEDSEADLMVMLSGMVGSHATQLEDE